MFLQASVCPLGGEGGVRGRGHTWQGGMCGRGGCAWWRACMSGVCMAGGHAWWGHAWQGACVAEGVHGRAHGHACPLWQIPQDTVNGRVQYASYWIAFLCLAFLLPSESTLANHMFLACLPFLLSSSLVYHIGFAVQKPITKTSQTFFRELPIRHQL